MAMAIERIEFVVPAPSAAVRGKLPSSCGAERLLHMLRVATTGVSGTDGGALPASCAKETAGSCPAAATPTASAPTAGGGASSADGRDEGSTAGVAAQPITGTAAGPTGVPHTHPGSAHEHKLRTGQPGGNSSLSFMAWHWRYKLHGLTRPWYTSTAE